MASATCSRGSLSTNANTAMVLSKSAFATGKGTGKTPAVDFQVRKSVGSNGWQQSVEETCGDFLVD